MPAVLIVNKSDGRTIPLTPPVQVIGRSSTKSDIVLDNNDGVPFRREGATEDENTSITVSRGHAQVAFREIDGVWTIVDLESLNGTKVNSVPVKATPVALQNNDSISLGSINLRFQLQNEGREPAPTDSGEVELSAVDIVDVVVK